MKKLLIILIMGIFLFPFGTAIADINWQAAKEKYTLEKCYSFFPAVKEVIDAEFTIPEEVVPEPASNYPPG